VKKQFLGGLDDDIRMGKTKDPKKQLGAGLSSKAKNQNFLAKNKRDLSLGSFTGKKQPVPRTVSIRVDNGSTTGGK